MRVYELNGQSETQRPGHRVAVIGSCRVLSPFQDLVMQGRATRLWDDGVLTHSLPEVKQLIAYTLGHQDIPAEMRTFVFQPDDKPERTAADRSMLNTIDTFFVELSEKWCIGNPPYVFNSNHFINQFVSKHSEELLDWYRALVAGTLDREIIDATMARFADRSSSERAWFGMLLRHTEATELTDAAAAAMLDEIVFDPGKQWIVVPHFLVPGVRGAQMGDRAEAIKQVQKISSDKGLTLFDPTRLIEAYGAETALAKQGRDAYHYDDTFMPIVVDALLKTAGLIAVSDEVALSAAERINASLLELHRQRLALGVDESGLYAHYKLLLEQKTIVGRDIGELVGGIINRLPKFDLYHVLRAGLGEIGFVLSSLGLPTVAFDRDDRRFEAMQAGLDRLGSDDPMIARWLTIQKGVFPDAPLEGNVLGLATHLIGYSPAREEEVLSRLGQYGALLIRPRSFLFNRPSENEQMDLMAKLEKLGFSTVKDVGRGVVYVAKPERSVPGA
jgi:hypothetical protein